MAIQKEPKQVCSLRLGVNEYGWLVRYCDEQDITMSYVMRKALQMYRTAITNKRNKEKISNSKVWGQPIKIIKNEEYENIVELNEEVFSNAVDKLSPSALKVWYYFYKNEIGSVIYCKIQEANMTKQKIIYTRWIMMRLLERGFRFVDSFQNPTNPELLVWAFEDNEEFEKAFAEIVKEGRNYGD